MTTYTLRIPVTAYRVNDDGSLPEEAREAMDGRVVNLRRVTGEQSDREMRQLIDIKHYVPWFIVPDRHYDYWHWWDEGTSERYKASAGDWVVVSEYGVEAMSDAAFRELCEEVGDA